MSVRTMKRVRPDVLREDTAVANAVREMNDYAPAAAHCTLDKINAAVASLGEKQTKAQNTKISAVSASDAMIAEEWAFHDLMKDVKNQVRAQYGLNSDEVQAIGLKKANKRKSPVRQARTSKGNGSADADQL